MRGRRASDSGLRFGAPMLILQQRAYDDAGEEKWHKFRLELQHGINMFIAVSPSVGENELAAGM